MTKPYPMELGLRAVRFVEAGESRHAVAKRLGVSVSCVIKWLQRLSKTGSVKPDQIGGYRPVKIIGEYRDWAPERNGTCVASLRSKQFRSSLLTRSQQVGT